MINNIEQLIMEASKFNTEEEKLQFIMNYFLNTVQYDYTYLLIKGYIQDSISELEPFSSEKDIVVNPFKKGKVKFTINGEEKEFDDSMCRTIRISKGSSKLLDRIDKLTHEVNGDVELFFRELRNILIEELLKHLDNVEIATENVDRIIENLKRSMREGIIAGKYFVSWDIKSIILKYLLEPNKHMPPIIENGLLKRGVCQHYANYLADLLSKIGITAKRVYGISELGHAWIAAIVDGRLVSIDLTRAIFIRDKFKGIPKEQNSSDWLISSFEDSFRMQPKRMITAVDIDENGDKKLLPYALNSENFDETIITNLLLEDQRKK